MGDYSCRRTSFDGCELLRSNDEAEETASSSEGSSLPTGSCLGCGTLCTKGVSCAQSWFGGGRKDTLSGLKQSALLKDLSDGRVGVFQKLWKFGGRYPSALLDALLKLRCEN